jgi:hypothetical protein
MTWRKLKDTEPKENVPFLMFYENRFSVAVILKEKDSVWILINNSGRKDFFRDYVDAYWMEISEPQGE